MITKEKRQLLLKFLEDNVEAFKSFELWEKDDEEVAKYALSKDSNLLKFSGPQIRKNKEFLSKILKGNKDKDLWYYVDIELRKDYDFVNNNMSESVVENLCMKMHLYNFFKPGREEFLEKCKNVSGIYEKIPNVMRTDEIGKYILNLGIGNSDIFHNLSPESYDKEFVENLLISGKITFNNLSDEQKRDSFYQIVVLAEEISSVAYQNVFSLNLTEISTEEEFMEVIRDPFNEVYTTSSYFEEEEAKEIIYKFLKRNETFKKIAVKEFNRSLDINPFKSDTSSIVYIKDVLSIEKFIVLYEKEKMKEDLLLEDNKSENKNSQKRLKKF